MKILIVDDSSVIQNMVSGMLKELGHESAGALNGQEAVDKIKEMGDIELVLLDWNMPIMTGLQFLEKNQEESFFSNPVVMMTTENAPEKIMLALERGASEYIMKPFTSDILQNKLQMVEDLIF